MTTRPFFATKGGKACHRFPLNHDYEVSKGLGFPVVALPCVGQMPAPGEDEQEATGVFYVAATQATQGLVLGVAGDSGFAGRLHG